MRHRSRGDDGIEVLHMVYEIGSIWEKKEKKMNIRKETCKKMTIIKHFDKVETGKSPD